MYILGLSNLVGDEDYLLTQLFHSKNHGEPGNCMFYTNSDLEALLDEALMVYIHYQAYISGVSEQIEDY